MNTRKYEILAPLRMTKKLFAEIPNCRYRWHRAEPALTKKGFGAVGAPPLSGWTLDFASEEMVNG